MLSGSVMRFDKASFEARIAMPVILVISVIILVISN